MGMGMKQPLEIMTCRIISILRLRLFIICVSKITYDDNMIQLYYQVVRQV